MPGCWEWMSWGPCQAWQGNAKNDGWTQIQILTGADGFAQVDGTNGQMNIQLVRVVTLGFMDVCLWIKTHTSVNLFCSKIEGLPPVPPTPLPVLELTLQDLLISTDRILFRLISKERMHVPWVFYTSPLDRIACASSAKPPANFIHEMRSASSIMR